MNVKGPHEVSLIYVVYNIILIGVNSSDDTKYRSVTFWVLLGSETRIEKKCRDNMQLYQYIFLLK